MNSTDFFRCDRCHIECRIESSDSTGTVPLIIQHCPESEGIAVLGKVTRFEERRGGGWVDVYRWIDAA